MAKIERFEDIQAWQEARLLTKDLGKNNWVNSCGAGLWPALHHAGGTPAPQYENDQLISARLLKHFTRSRKLDVGPKTTLCGIKFAVHRSLSCPISPRALIGKRMPTSGGVYLWPRDRQARLRCYSLYWDF